MDRSIVFCSDCKHSQPEEDSTWNLRCHNIQVNRKDSWALSAATDSHGQSRGTSCHTERDNKSWFAACGISGKQWEPK